MQLKYVKRQKNNKIIIYLKNIIRKLNKYVENKNERKYKKLKIKNQYFKKCHFKQDFKKRQKLLKKHLFIKPSNKFFN